MKKYTKIIIISFLFLILLTIPVLASNYNALADFGSDHGSPEKDGAVDFEDLMIFSQAYNSTPSDPNWNPACDICGQGSSDPDGTVDFEDLMPLADSFGEREEKEWTVMFYMAGDDNIWPFGLIDLEKIAMALKLHPINSGKINVVAQYDSLGELKVFRYHLKPDYLIPDFDIITDIVQVLPELNMSSPDNLTNFINWAKEEYSAKRYALVLWGHGGGWRSRSSNRGLLTDQNPWKNAKMSIEQLAGALNDANQRMDLVICHSCLMQTMEVVYELKSLVSNNLPDYFIASQQSNSGLPWFEVTDYLCSNYTASPEDFCREIIDKYSQSDKCDPEWGAFSAVNMNYLSLNRVSFEIDKFADALLASQYPDQIESAKAETQSVNVEEARNYKDLKHFAEKIKEKGVADCYTRADSIITLIEDMFPSGYETHVTGGSVDHCNGINIELPTDSSDYLDWYKYEKFAEDTHWDEFISRGSSVANVRARALTTDINGNVEYKVKISWDEYKNAESYTIFKGTVEDVVESIHTTDASTLEYYDSDVDPSKTYYYAVIAKGDFGSGETPLGEVIATKFLPACSLISPPDDPDGSQPFHETNPEFRWAPVSITLPYGIIKDIKSAITVYDLTAGERVWFEIIDDFTIDNIIYGDNSSLPGLQNEAPSLKDDHRYKWYVEFRGYDEDNQYYYLSQSRSQEWEFTYREQNDFTIGAWTITGYDPYCIQAYEEGSIPDRSILVYWTQISGAEEYRVYRSVNGDSNFNLIYSGDGINAEGLDVDNEIGWYDFDTTPGNSYYYKVSYVVNGQESIPSDVVTRSVWLPECSLASPPNYNPDNPYDQPVTEPEPLLEWNPVGVSSYPYQGDIQSGKSEIWVVAYNTPYPVSGQGEGIWAESFDDLTTSATRFDPNAASRPLVSGYDHIYAWESKGIGYDDNADIVAMSWSGARHFFYMEPPEIIEPPVTLINIEARTSNYSTSDTSKARDIFNRDQDGNKTAIKFFDDDASLIKGDSIYRYVGPWWEAYPEAEGYRIYGKINDSNYELMYDWDVSDPQFNYAVAFGYFGFANPEIGDTVSFYVIAYNNSENWETAVGIPLTKTIDNETFLPPIYLNQPQDYGEVNSFNYLFQWTPIGDILPYGEVLDGYTHIRVYDNDYNYYWYDSFSDFTTSQASYSGDALTPGNTYHWCVTSYGFDFIYDTNESIAVSQSQEWEFTYTGTSGESPTVTTLEAYTITKTAATLWGEIVSTGGLTVTRRGFEYKDSAGGSTFDWHDDGDWSANDYIYRVAVLVAGHTYLYRAYAVNDKGTGYGAWESFKTTEEVINPPSLTTVGADNIQETSVRFIGRIDDTGGEDADWRGFRIEDALTGTTYYPEQESK